MATDTSTWVETPDVLKQKAVSVGTNDVVRISSTNGAIGIIQFTGFGPASTTYRTKFRAGNRTPVISGQGVLAEDYARSTNAFGAVDVSSRRGSESTEFDVGSFHLRWSCGSKTNGWLYYHPVVENIEVLNLSDFDLVPL